MSKRRGLKDKLKNGEENNLEENGEEKMSKRRGLKDKLKNGEENNLEENGEEKVLQCEKCGQHYHLDQDGTEQPLNGEEYKKWKENQAERLYPKLPYTCQQCKGGVVLESINKHIKSTKVENNSLKITARNNSFSLLYIGGIFVILAGLSYVYSPTIWIWLGIQQEEKLREEPFPVRSWKQSSSEKLLEVEIDKLEDTYSRQEDRVWYTLLAGIKSVAREIPNQPSVFLMLYDSASAGYTARCIAKDVVRAASKYLMGRQKEALEYSGKYFERKDFLDDPGKLLIYLNDTVREKGSLVVTDLQDIPPKVAKSLHFICDRYSPLVERAVLFFTLSVKAFSPRIQRDAEARLNELWANHLDDSFLNPLITRMTPNILKITSDNYNC